jgi:phosphocarrier protein HPr
MIKCLVKIKNKLGLHARAATKLARVVSRYNSSAQVYKDDKSVDAKSIISLLMLEAPVGTSLTFEFDGSDEEIVSMEVKRLIEDKFGEDS